MYRNNELSQSYWEIFKKTGDPLYYMLSVILEQNAKQIMLELKSQKNSEKDM